MDIQDSFSDIEFNSDIFFVSATDIRMVVSVGYRVSGLIIRIVNSDNYNGYPFFFCEKGITAGFKPGGDGLIQQSSNQQ